MMLDPEVDDEAYSTLKATAGDCEMAREGLRLNRDIHSLGN
jgi:hypothetical protein